MDPGLADRGSLRRCKDPQPPRLARFVSMVMLSEGGAEAAPPIAGLCITIVSPGIRKTISLYPNQKGLSH